MVTVLFDSVRRWWQSGAAVPSGLSWSTAAGPVVPVRLAVAPGRVAPRLPALARRLPAKPLTPFGTLVRSRAGVSISAPSAAAARSPAYVPSNVLLNGPSPARRAAHRFWMTVDPQDRRHTALGGSFAEVCAALEQLAALEERRY